MKSNTTDAIIRMLYEVFETEKPLADCNKTGTLGGMGGFSG